MCAVRPGMQDEAEAATEAVVEKAAPSDYAKARDMVCVSHSGEGALL